MKRNIPLLLALLYFVPLSHAQGLAGDLLAGKLVNPKVGQWAWYNLTDARAGKKYVIRQAIVGEEKIARKSGYWVEFEIIPEVGFKMVYKMLLTGPANDPKNIHRVIQKSGVDPAREVAVDAAAPPSAAPESKRRSLGQEEVATMNGMVRAEHYEVTQADQVIGVWINEKVNPTGIVRMQSLDGVMVLRNHGEGGEFANSIITETPLPPDETTAAPVPKAEIKAETKPKEPKTDEKQEGTSP
jgi:hypothetical protein